MATALEKNTKKLIERKLDALFSKQQKLNGNVGGNEGGMPKAAYGWDGGIRNSMTDPILLNNIDVTGNRNTSITPMSGVGFNPMQPMAFDPNYQAGKVSASGNSYLANANNPSGTGGSVFDQPNYGSRPGLDTAGGTTDWSKAGAFAGQIAPMVYNMAKGLQKPEKTTPNYNPYESQIRSLMSNRRFNIDPLLNANLTANAVNNRNIRNVAGSRGELMGNLTASQNARMNADMSAWSTKTNQDNQYMGEQAQMDANLGANRAAMDWNVQDANSRNRAATNAFMGQGLNDLSQFSQVQQQMKNQKFRDAQLASLYPDMYSQIYQFQPFMQQIVGAAKQAGGIK